MSLAVVMVLAATVAGPGSVGCGEGGEIPAPRPDLETLCLGGLAGLAAAGRERLDRLRFELETLLAGTEVAPEEVAEGYGSLGRMAQAHGLDAIAEGSYRNAERLAPGDFRWPYLLGVLYGPQGRLREAGELFERSLSLEPRYFPARLRLARDAFELGELEVAESHYRRLLELDHPEPHAHAHEGLGQVALSRQRLAEAAGHFGRAVELRPSALALHAPLARIHRALGDVERAQEHASRYGPQPLNLTDPIARDVWREPRSLEWLVASADRHFREGRFEEAFAVASVAAESHPGAMRPRLWRARTLLALGRRDEAHNELEAAATLDPRDRHEELLLARLLLATGEASRASTIFRRLLEADPDDVRALVGLGSALRGEGRHGQAEFYLREALEREPGSAPANLYLGLVLLDVGSHSGAVHYLERAHRLDPSTESAHLLARQWAASPDPTVRDGRRALALAQEISAREASVTHAITMALALAELGRCSEAASWVERTLAALEDAEEGDRTSLVAPLTALLGSVLQGPPCRPEWGPDAPSHLDEDQPPAG